MGPIPACGSVGTRAVAVGRGDWCTVTGAPVDTDGAGAGELLDTEGCALGCDAALLHALAPSTAAARMIGILRYKSACSAPAGTLPAPTNVDRCPDLMRALA